MRRRAAADRLHWTELGVHMGFTAEAAQREEILTAADEMSWTDPAARPPWFDSPLLRAIATVIVGRGQTLRRVGVAQLAGARQLIGLHDSVGVRRYVLDLGAEAIHLLTEFPVPTGGARRSVA